MSFFILTGYFLILTDFYESATFQGFINSAGNMKDEHFDSLVQDCSISIANAIRILQSCTKPLIYNKILHNKLFMSYDVIKLTHWGLVTPYGDKNLGQHWLR